MKVRNLKSAFFSKSLGFQVCFGIVELSKFISMSKKIKVNLRLDSQDFPESSWK